MSIVIASTVPSDALCGRRLDAPHDVDERSRRRIAAVAACDLAVHARELGDERRGGVPAHRRRRPRVGPRRRRPWRPAAQPPPRPGADAPSSCASVPKRSSARRRRRAARRREGPRLPPAPAAAERRTPWRTSGRMRRSTRCDVQIVVDALQLRLRVALELAQERQAHLEVRPRSGRTHPSVPRRSSPGSPGSRRPRAPGARGGSPCAGRARRARPRTRC